MKKHNDSHRSVTKDTLTVFWEASLKHPRLLWSTLAIFPIASTLQDLITPLIIAQVVNKLVELTNDPTATINYWSTFGPYLIAFIICATVGQRVFSLALTLLAKLQMRTRIDIDHKVYEVLLRQSMRFHNDSFGGALVSDATKFSNAYLTLGDVLVIQGVQLFAKFLIASFIIGWFYWPIALIMIAWTGIFMWTVVVLTKRRAPISQSASVADSTVTAHLADSISNISVVQSFAREDHEKLLFQGKAQDRADKRLRSWVKAIKHATIGAWQIIFIQFVILIFSIYAILSGDLQIGTFLLIQVYLAQLIAVLRSFANMARTVEQNISDAREMTKTLQLVPAVTDPGNPQNFKVSQGMVSFDHVTFRHEGKQSEELFADFSLTLRGGEKVGLVGHSGAGKSTLTKLLMRFMDVNKGRILIDGQDVRGVRQYDLRSELAYVPQEPLLFHRTIAENIAYGKPKVSRAEIESAAKKAHADSFIKRLPQGYDTLVGERGVKLSGGQRQRIAIARAILKDAPILLLDEATSALDSESEKAIQQALLKLMEGRTTLIIAHRLSTIQKLDRIIVLQEGKIVEEGTHASLLKKQGVYAGLWAHQSGGFLEG